MVLSTEFDLFFEYKVESLLKLEVNIPRQEIPLVCSAFDIMMSERFGASFYYPRYPDNKNRCRYEWFLNYQKDPYGIRVSTYFDVGDEDIKALPFMVSWGPRFASNIGTQFSKEIQRRVAKEIQSVLMDVNRIIHDKPHKMWTFLSHVELPPGQGVGKTVAGEFITVYNSVQRKKQGNLLTAIGIHLPAHFGAQAKNIGRPIFNKFISLLSLLAGAPIRKTRIERPKKFKVKEVFEGKDVPTEKIYPMTCYRVARKQQFDLMDIVSVATDLIAQQSIRDDQILWRSINAYVSGQEIKQSQPTLSSVAFIASLAAYSSRLQCHGEVTCSTCGNLRSFHHDLVSEKDSIIETIRTVLEIKSGSSEDRDLHNLIRQVHSEQRSAFVHDAALRHAELDKDSELGHPGESKIISDELEFEENLESVQEIARRVLLFRLLPFNPKIQTILGSGADSRIKRRTAFICTSTIKGGRPVGVRVGRGENEAGIAQV